MTHFKKRLTEGPTFYDQVLVDELEKNRQALRDYLEHAMSGAKAYLAEELRTVDGFKMTQDVAKSHVERLAERVYY